MDARLRRVDPKASKICGRIFSSARTDAGHTAQEKQRLLAVCASVRSFYKHHTQQLAAAAQVGDAKAIRLKITHEKMCLMKALKAGARA